ncbi:MAG: amidohydrolase family protein, partial [Steroidobacteraceae bacterium]|nr:amidohydrolase family protein [Steroidobacteraceae bacterium]
MPSSTPRDLLIHARWVLPIEPRGAVLEDHSIVVQAGRIEAILPREQASAIPARQVLERPAHAVLPGFVNAHAHAAMTLLRGAAAGRPLEPWLRQVVWPLESRLVDADFVRDGTEQA